MSASHSEHHAHSHHHHHSETLRGKKLLGVTLLNGVITLAEIVGGILSNSLSLLSDAVHNLGDTLALLFAYIAHRIGKKKPTQQYTFGYKRAEIITAFLNALILILICLFLFREAVVRLYNPEPIKGLLMLIVALVGLAANWISVVVLQKDKDANINIKAAYLHLLGDTLSSVAVIIGGVAIYFFNILWIDPMITIVVGVYIIIHTWSVLKQSIDILMQSAPRNIDVSEIVDQITHLPHVEDLHHLHIWQLNEEQTHFEAHVCVSEQMNMTQLTQLRETIETLLQQHHISHTTLQISARCCDVHAGLIVEE